MKTAPPLFRAILPLAITLAGSTVLAEGTAQLNTTQALRSGAQMYVDILDATTERIRWTGVGSVTVTGPSGESVATLSSGQSTGTLIYGDGAYGVRVNQGQVVNVAWDVEVENQVSSGGRLYSYDWPFNAGSFAPERSTYASFYALIPSGIGSDTAVIELKLDGLAGYVYNINANKIGVNGPNAGRSVPMYGHTVTPEYPMYIQPPTIGSYARAVPDIFGLDYIGGVSVNVDGASIDPCNKVVPGQSFGRFQFQSTIEGTYHLQCDLNGDGVFDSASDDDLFQVGTTTVGVNTVLWDGLHQGQPVAYGSYDCRVRVNVGEFHYVGSDIETSYQGMRMFEVQSDGSRRALTMYWNDELVQSTANTMPSGAQGLASSGLNGIDSGDYTAAAVANVNARSWGNFSSSGKGNVNYLDTYVWLDSSASTEITLEAVDALTDTDGDGLGDFEEDCYYGTDPEDPDSDNDGTDDGDQYAGGSSGGTVGGLESNGRMATQLAERAIRRTRYTPAWGDGKVGPGAGRMSMALTYSPGELQEWLPRPDVDGLTALDSTPADLPSLTNADDVFALDYVDAQGHTVATVFVAATSGQVYEHSKALCDRAGGSELLAVGAMQSPEVLLGSFANAHDATLDHAVTFKLYENAEEGFDLEARWLRLNYPAPSADQSVLNVQIWSRSPEVARELSREWLAAMPLRERETPVLDESNPIDPGANLVAPMLAAAPDVAFRSGQLLGSEVTLNLARFGGGTGQNVQVRFSALDPLGRPLTPLWFDVDAFSESTSLAMDLGLMRETTADLFVDGEHVDQLWLSDGAWSPFTDSLWGGGSESENFSSSACELKDRSVGGDEVALPLSGCGQIEARRVDQYVGVARHLNRGIERDGYASLAVWVKSDDTFEVCGHGPDGSDARCEEFDAEREGDWVELSLGELTEVRLVTITRASSGSLVASGLTLSSAEAESTEEPSALGCAAADGNPWIVLMTLVGGAWLASRRRRTKGTQAS